MSQNETNLPAEEAPQSSQTAKSPKKGFFRKPWRVWTLVLVLLAVLVAAASALFPQTIRLDRVARFFTYLGLNGKDGYGHIVFDANNTNDFAAFSDGLLVGSESGLTLFDLYGQQKAVVQGSLPSPVIQCCDSLSVCYSPGSSYIAAISKSGSTVMDQTVSGLLLDVDLSSDGYMTYITSESGFKSVCTVLNRNQDAFFKLSSRTSYLNACAVSPGGTYLAVAGLGEKDSTFTTTVTLLRTTDALTDLDGQDSTAVRVELGNQILYDLKFLSPNRLCAIGQNTVTFLDMSGEILATVSLENRYLADYAYSDQGYVTLALNQNQAGDKYELLTLDAAGGELGSRYLGERVRSLSVSGGCVGVLTDHYLESYNKKLVLLDKTEQPNPTAQILLRPDGTALCVSSSSATLLIP